MKKILLLIAVALLSEAAAAQPSSFLRPDRLYFAGGLGKVMYIPIREGVGPVFVFTAVGAHCWGAAISYRSTSYTAERLPPYYNGPYFQAGSQLPFDEMHWVSLQLLREWRAGSKPVSFSVEGGASGICFNTWHFTPVFPSVKGGWRYESVTRWAYLPGISVRGRIRIPVKHIAGLEFAVAGLFNRRKNRLSLELLLSFSTGSRKRPS